MLIVLAVIRTAIPNTSFKIISLKLKKPVFMADLLYTAEIKGFCEKRKNYAREQML